MSTTIGLGYSANDNTDPFEELQALAEEYDYGLLNGIERSEQDVRAGIAIAQRHLGWGAVALLQAPRERNVALAFAIHQELTDRETTHRQPRFFEFLDRLAALAAQRCSRLGIFFAGEWSETDRVRYCCGSVEDLIALLSMPGHWGIRYLVPETGRLQDSDETPLVFDLRPRPSRQGCRND